MKSHNQNENSRESEIDLLKSIIEEQKEEILKLKENPAQDKILQLNRTLRTISEINQLIVRETDRDIVLSETCKILVEHGKFPMVWIGMLDSKGKDLKLKAHYGFPDHYFTSEKLSVADERFQIRPAGNAIITGKNEICFDAKNDENFEKLKEDAQKFDFGACAAFPLKIDKKVVGVINVNVEKGDDLSADIIDLLDELAADISLSLKLIDESEARKKAEKSLNLANIVIENSPAVLFIWEVQEGWPVSFVSKNVDQFGYSPEEFLSGETPFSTIIHPDDLNKISEEVKKYTADGSTNFRQEYRIITKQGNTVWVDDRTRIERDSNGKAKYYQGIVLDISQQKIIESALWETQQMLNLVLDNIPQRIFWKDKNFKYLGCNNKFAEDAGLNHPDQILGKNDFELIWKDVAHLYRADDKDVIENDISKINYEEPQVRENASTLWLRTSKLPLKNKEGDTLGVLGCYEDITEWRAAEQALEESEKRYRNFVDQTSDGFYVLRTDKPIDIHSSVDKKLKESYENFIVKDCNKIFAEMYGYNSVDEIKGVELEQLHGDWDLEKNIQSFKKFLQNDLKVKNTETVEYDKFNNRKYFLNNYIGIVEDDKLVEIWGTQQDITEKKEAEQALIASEEKFKSVFTDSHDCIYVTSADGKILNMNDAGLALFNIDKESISDFNVSEIYFNAEERGKFQDDINKEGFVKDYPVRLKNSDNIELDCLITSSVKKDKKGNVISYQGIIRDISEQKKAEIELINAKNHAIKADKLKTEFLAQMSHEIRTPINTLLSFASLIHEETKDSHNQDLEQYFEFQLRAGKRIIRTIDLILNMSEVQTGSFEKNPKEIDVKELVTEVHKDYSDLAKNKGLRLDLSVPDENLRIFADEYSIHQILSNLIDNSIKYTHTGKINLNLKLNDAKNKVVLEVSDTGIGIANTYISKIFDPFSQEEQGYTRKFEGSGLGLALVKKYCDMNNGEVSVVSRKNIGTTFRVSFELLK